MHTNIFIYIYIHSRVCVCVCVSYNGDGCRRGDKFDWKKKLIIITRPPAEFIRLQPVSIVRYLQYSFGMHTKRSINLLNR